MHECPICHKASEVLVEKRMTNYLWRRFQCGHSYDLRHDYLRRIEEIHEEVKEGGLPFRSIEDRLAELDRLIRKLKKTGESTVAFAEEVREELNKLRSAKLPQRKAMARAFTILQEDWEILSGSDCRSIDFLRGQFQKFGDLSVDEFGELKRLENKYVNIRRGVSRDIIAMRTTAAWRTK